MKKQNMNLNNNLAATYFNSKLLKSQILENNKEKSGIYRWTNNLNNKSYIGSAKSLTKRFYIYYSEKRLLKSNMAIYKALVKYGHENFTLDILEYCDPDLLIKKEQSYLDFYKPEYNLNPNAGSSLGYKHLDVTLKKMRNLDRSLETRKNLSEAAKGRILSKETREKISVSRLGMKLSCVTRAKLSLASSLNVGKKVQVVNTKTQITQYFSTMTEAGKALNVSRTAIYKAIKSGKNIQTIYQIFCVKNI